MILNLVRRHSFSLSIYCLSGLLIFISYHFVGMIHTAAWDKALSSANSDAKSGFQSFSKDPPYTNAPDALQRYYKPLIDQCTTYAQIAKGSSIPPDHVANAVLHALTSRFPRNRYLVGVDAWSADFAKRVMSDFVTDVMGFWSW